jgi:hypothetical protein
MQDIPEPRDSGSTGTQEAVQGDIIPPVADVPTSGLPIVQAVEGLRTASPRSIGGEGQAAFIVGTISQSYHDLLTTKMDLVQTRADLDKSKDECSRYKTRAEVLTDRIRSHRRMNHFKNLVNAVGIILIGGSIQLYTSSLYLHAFVAFPLGILLVILGMVALGRESEE